MMDLQAKKLELIQEFIKINSEEVLLKIEEIINSNSSITEAESLNPMTIEEFNNRIDQSMEDSRNGRMIKVSDLKEKIKTWS